VAMSCVAALIGRRKAVENVGVDLTPDLEREGAEELGVGLCVWRMVDGGWGLVSVGVRVRRRLVNRG
jgi:hypothetical protein